MRLILIILTTLLYAIPTIAQEKAELLIEGSPVYVIEGAVEKPDTTMDYNLVIDLITGSSKDKNPVSGLTRLSRMINLHVAGGVPKDNLNVIAVIHAGALKSVLTNDKYQLEFKEDNPNIPIIKSLTEAGVKLYVCGQSLIFENYIKEDVLPEVGISISALTILTTYQLKGYATLKF